MTAAAFTADQLLDRGRHCADHNHADRIVALQMEVDRLTRTLDQAGVRVDPTYAQPFVYLDAQPVPTTDPVVLPGRGY